MSVTRTIDVTVSPTAEELAQEWWGMGEDEQAQFFNELHRLCGGRLCFQLQAVTDSGYLQDGGRQTMRLIGDYASRTEDI